MYQQTFRKCGNEKSMWFRAVLDSDWNVYHDAASESGMGRDTYDSAASSRI